MQLTPDCIRDVLLELETFPMGAYKSSAFCNCLEKYSNEQILYTLIKLFEGHYVNAVFERSSSGTPIIFHVYDMTFQGHEFLENIRSETIWNQRIKPIAEKVGSKSFEAIAQIAGSVITTLITNYLSV